MTADDIITHLNLRPHPEGGWHRQTWSAKAQNGDRPTGTAIYFLLKAGERSHWHTVDATEIWLYHAGAPLTLFRAETESGPASKNLLGPDLGQGHHPQLIVAPHHWQAAESTGAWTLASCTVSPGFHFDGFTLADPEFTIPTI